jgi:predicted nucleotidyltransferase/DNA-binding transcriptional ArsR family regulator
MAGLFSSVRAVEVLIALDQCASASMADLARYLDVAPSAVQKALATFDGSGLVESFHESRRRVLYSIGAPAGDVNGLLNIAVGSIPASRHVAIAFRANPGVAFAGHDAIGWIVVLGRNATPGDGAALDRAIGREFRLPVTRFTRNEVADRILDGDSAIAERARAVTVCRGSVDRIFADPRRHADPNSPLLGTLHPSLKQPSRRSIREVASQNGLAKIVVFGSAVHADFRPDSDVDVLVRHRPGVARSLESEFALREQLEDMFDRDVDLVEERVARPAIARRAAREGVALYGRT